MPNHSSWTFLTNYAHVVVVILRDPNIRLKDVASQVGLTERAVQKIVGELVDENILNKTKDGRRNQYSVDLDAPLRHPVESGKTLRNLLAEIVPDQVRGN